MPRANWRKEIDLTLERELLAAGFEPFDGIAYSFPVSDEVLCVVQLFNQTLAKRANAERALLNTRIGIIHYQLGYIQSKLDRLTGRSLWRRALGGAEGWIVPPIGYIDLVKAHSSETRLKLIQELIQTICTTKIPVVKQNFQNLDSIIRHLEQAVEPKESLFCSALVLAGQADRAKKRADDISANLETSHVHKLGWPVYKQHFDEWLAQGAPVPGLATAKAETMEAAAKRRVQMAEIPAHSRPTE
ncbi:MAG: hypothetical protein JST01_16340 [Cyanobacteria bacterium SZAS TMP-1]|nr:hypothetical protein [Cyanobacteria bacterium SZAS TMP-1]